jgi:peptide chain release factor 2
VGFAVTLTNVSDEFDAALRDLTGKLTQIESVMDLDALRAQVADLEQQASSPNLWDDPEAAQKVTSQLSHRQGELRRVSELRQRADDLAVLYELSEAEGDSGSMAEAEAEVADLGKAIDGLEVRTLLSGEYDDRNAVVTIRSEAGGVDAADFAEMLLRMYLRWAERHGYPTDVYDISYAEEAGIKSATFKVTAPYVYGTLSVEQGTHRLVRISPFDNQGRRQTSFAHVEVLPEVEEVDHVDIAEKDIRVDVYRSSGPGGQSVNTTDSAVRITHLPTGIVVSCQNEKSQLQNKAAALKVLQARLMLRKKEEERAEMDALKDGGSSWGNQMRSYVLHPYQMVKDLRTDFEVGNPSAVLDGEIDGFLDAGIRWRKQTATA